MTVLERQSYSGFALPTVLGMTSAMLILLTALIMVVDLERASSRVEQGGYRAELALSSGLEAAKVVLARAGSTDTFVIAEERYGVRFDDDGDGQISELEDEDFDEMAADGRDVGRPYLFALQGRVEDERLRFEAMPLFTTESLDSVVQVGESIGVVMPESPGLPSEDERDGLDTKVVVQGVESGVAPVTSWHYVRDKEGEAVARYAYWVEDLQAKFDVQEIPGNERNAGRHARANDAEVWAEAENWVPALQDKLERYVSEGGVIPLWPAPGINPGYEEGEDGFGKTGHKLLSEVPLYSLDRNQDADVNGARGIADLSDLERQLADVSEFAQTSASLIALTGAEAPLQRVGEGVDKGRLRLQGGDGPEPRWIEEAMTVGNRSYREAPRVPFVQGIEPAMMGVAKLNLNRLLEDATSGGVGNEASGADEVDEIAGFMEEAVPQFAERRQGGFPVGSGASYFKTLAAGILDYADTDTTPRSEGNEYRGLDAHPLVTEFLFTAEVVGTPSSTLELDTYLFAELWNMSNHPLSGEVALAYDVAYTASIGANPSAGFRAETIDGLIRQDDGYYYTPEQSVSLAPNEYRLISAGPFRVSISIGQQAIADDFTFEGTPNELSGEEGASYRLRWNGVLAERSGGGLELQNLTFKMSGSNQDVRDTRAVICGTWGDVTQGYRTGMGDPRQSWWAGLNETATPGCVNANAFPRNFSPGRRNVRWAIWGSGNLTYYKRVLPSEWPDGGHDAVFSESPYETYYDTDVMPDDPVLQNQVPPPDKGAAPMFVSNLGRFISETELGNIYDPLMWQEPSTSTLRANENTAEFWGVLGVDSVDGTRGVLPGDSSEASQHVGGGNTLRIGRPEHRRFATNSSLAERTPAPAARLLDLFHCGVPLSSDVRKRTGPLVQIEGHVNLNTASREVLRTLAAGYLNSDPSISERLSSFAEDDEYRFEVSPSYGRVSATDGTSLKEAFEEGGEIADAIIAARPLLSRSQLADLNFPGTSDYGLRRGLPVFGNENNHAEVQNGYNRSDKAREEVFARVYNSSTVRSRNFMVYVIGEALTKGPSGRYSVLASRKKSFRVFIDVEERDEDTGEFEKTDVKVDVVYEKAI